MTRPDWQSIRMTLLIRSLGLCEVCSAPLPNDWETQHRRARGQGGTRRTDVHSLPNLLALCPPCHSIIERHERAWAFDCGYALRQRSDPLAAPVLLHGQRWVLLTDDGRYESLLPAGTTELDRRGEAPTGGRVNGQYGGMAGALRDAPATPGVAL